MSHAESKFFIVHERIMQDQNLCLSEWADTIECIRNGLHQWFLNLWRSISMCDQHIRHTHAPRRYTHAPSAPDTAWSSTKSLWRPLCPKWKWWEEINVECSMSQALGWKLGARDVHVWQGLMGVNEFWTQSGLRFGAFLIHSARARKYLYLRIYTH